MELALSSEEATLLNRILVDYLSNLRAELVATDSYALRVELHKEEDSIRAMLSRLDALMPVHA